MTIYFEVSSSDIFVQLVKWVELTAQEQKDKVRRAIRDVATDIEKKASSLFRSPS